VVDLAYAALVLVSLAPAFLVRYPASADYLNHFVRLYVLAAPAGDPVHAFYRPEWHLMPNLGFDLPGLALTHVMSIEAAAKATWFAAVLASPVRSGSRPRSAWADRSHRAARRACLLCLPVTAGFIGFTLALAAALAVVALWFRMGQGNAGHPAGAQPCRRGDHGDAPGGADALAVAIVAAHTLQAPWRPVAVARRAGAAALAFVAPFLLSRFMEHPAPAGPVAPVFDLAGN